MENAKTQERIAGLIYAGGRGARMGGVDKAFLGEPPQIERMSGALAPFVEKIFITRQRDQRDVSAYGEVIYDEDADQGPLGGLVSALAHLQDYDYVLTAAVDGSELPKNFFDALRAAARPHAIASTDGQLHPTYSWIDLKNTKAIFKSYENGARALRSWANAENCGEAEFAQNAFCNHNR